MAICITTLCLYVTLYLNYIFVTCGYLMLTWWRCYKTSKYTIPFTQVNCNICVYVCVIYTIAFLLVNVNYPDICVAYG